MKKIIVFAFLGFFICWIVIATPKKLITIKYCLEPFRTFEIAEMNIKGIELEKLTDVLKKIKSENPDAKYELLAEVKNVLEMENKIIKAIENAGINLKHYWAPVSSIVVGKSGPYGPGFVDIHENKTFTQ
jgi:hypothetical protein